MLLHRGQLYNPESDIRTWNHGKSGLVMQELLCPGNLLTYVLLSVKIARQMHDVELQGPTCTTPDRL